jgi:hypothetical protein
VDLTEQITRYRHHANAARRVIVRRSRLKRGVFTESGQLPDTVERCYNVMRHIYRDLCDAGFRTLATALVDEDAALNSRSWHRLDGTSFDTAKTNLREARRIITAVR